MAARPRTYPIEAFRRIAKARGGRVLSSGTLSARGRVRMRCADGHEFAESPSSLLQGTWCPSCALARPNPARATHLAELQAIAAERGGKVVSRRYVTARVKLEFRCAQGHRWWVVPFSIKRGVWCPKCARLEGFERGRDRLEAAVRERGGVLLAAYVDSAEHVPIRCASGHEWTARPGAITAGAWCPRCARLSLDDMHAMAAQWGGRCLSKRYAGRTTELRWRCAAGHEWMARPGAIAEGWWCQRCEGTTSYDRASMRELARRRGGRCLAPAGPLVSTTAVRWRCSEGHEWEAPPSRLVLQGTWCPQCAIDRQRGIARTRLTLDAMQQTAARHGGRCVSEFYVNTATKLRWECARGHRWDAVPSNVRSGDWCPECAQRQPYSLDAMHAMARERGGRCLTEHWGNRRTALTFQCETGHVFDATRGWIRGGLWCPQCAERGMALPQRRKPPAPFGNRPRPTLTIEDMHTTAARFGGRCVSKRFRGVGNKLRWRCAAGHEWSATPGMLRARGTWCPICSHRSPRNLEELRALVKDRGGRCSSRFPGGKTGVRAADRREPLRLTCAHGHRFELMWGGLKSGAWCPECAEPAVAG